MVTNVRAPGSSYTLAAESRVQLSKWLAAFGRMAMEAQKVQGNLASVPQRLCMNESNNVFALVCSIMHDRQAGGTGALEMPTVAAVRSASKADRLFYDVTAEGQMDVNTRPADKQAAAVKPGLLEVTDTHARFCFAGFESAEGRQPLEFPLRLVEVVQTAGGGIGLGWASSFKLHLRQHDERKPWVTFVFGTHKEERDQAAEAIRVAIDRCDQFISSCRLATVTSPTNDAHSNVEFVANN
eukprot:SAG31_NODE_5669_length_2393_cov_1.883173_1_plen_239_part_10